jgi:hypothetical protein
MDERLINYFVELCLDRICSFGTVKLANLCDSIERLTCISLNELERDAFFQKLSTTHENELEIVDSSSDKTVTATSSFLQRTLGCNSDVEAQTKLLKLVLER